jgi:hypothetical protein
MVKKLYHAIEFVKNQKNQPYIDYMARKLVEMAIDTYIAILFLECAQNSERKAKVAEIWINEAESRVKSHHDYVTSGHYLVINNHRDIIG